MTRDNLIQAIYNNEDPWSCPDTECTCPCIECAEMQLKEYEESIEAAAIKRLANDVLTWLWEIDIPSSTCPEYIEHHKSVQSVMEKVKEKVRQMKGEK